METTNEPGRNRELGGHDGDDGDDRTQAILAHLALSGELLAACAAARLHGLFFEEIRSAFETQLAHHIRRHLSEAHKNTKENT